MLRISLIERANHAVTLRLEGSLAGPWVTEARKACERFLTEGYALKLLMTEVEFADPSGVTFLSSLRARGVALIDASPFVAAQLKTVVTSRDPAV